MAAALDGAVPVEPVAPPDNGAAPPASSEGEAAPAAKPRQRSRAESAARAARADAKAMLELPEDVADIVQPLGRNGAVFFYLDALNQFQSLAADKHGRAFIMQMFGARGDVLFEHYGKRNKDGELTAGFHADSVANALMDGCSRLGIIDPAEAVKGTGAWGDGKGGLVLHLGDRVWIDGKYQAPGRYGEHIFPAMPPTLRPALKPESGDAGAELLGMLDTWHWADPLQSHLMLGWIAQGFICGALRWRTHGILDGEKGSGKTTLFELTKGLFGSWLREASDVTPASLYQLMAAKAQPVFIDEFEGGMNPKRKADVVGVLRQASSGGKVLRGGDDHVGRSFSVQFPAFLTSIVPVALLPQDESRMIRVGLLPLADRAHGGKLPDLAPARLAVLGARLMRRMLDQWPRWARTLALYRDGLEAEAGMDARLQDTYGTILAAADLLLYDMAGGEFGEVAPLCQQIGALVAPQRAEQLSDQERCLAHLLQCQIDRGSGPRRSIASWLRTSLAVYQYGFADDTVRKEAERALGLVGLKLIAEPVTRAGSAVQRRLFVANSHAALARLFTDTPWPGSAGAMGAWVTVLRRIEGAEIAGAQYVGGQTQRGTLVPIGLVLDWEATA